MSTPGPFYVTTPIYYVNSVPHLGTFYTTVVADALARFHRARNGKSAETLFLTGLDEHGQRIERIARDKGVPPQAYCDEVAAKFQAMWARASIAYDDFIRTTQPRHRESVTDMWNRMKATGDIYAADYEGLYCDGCEEWKTDDDLVVEGGVKICPVHRRPVEPVKEKNYFFRLSAYQQRLLEFYAANRNFIRPESRYNEVVSFVSGGLRDLSVSRMSVKWGLPVPGDANHTIYVWIDALTNYLTAIGGPSAVQSEPRARALWAASHHLIAKDILRFHAVYWPAMLMAAGLPAPRQIFCHGYLTVKGQKISKSLPATRVDPNAIADELGVDPLRYFVLREYTFGADGDFTYETLFQRYESDLGNDLGNLLNRTVSLAQKLPGGAVLPEFHAPAEGPRAEEDLALKAAATMAVEEATAAWEDFAPSRALESTWSMVRRANAYIDRTAPWKLAKAEAWDDLRHVLSQTCEVIRRAALCVAPAMPTASQEILRQIGREGDQGQWPEPTWTGWPGATLTAAKPVFPRFEPDRQAALITQWSGAVAGETAAPAPAPSAAPAPASGDGISIDDFAKIDLRAATVLAAERVPKTEKLLKLEIDLGSERRTVVSGIAGAFTPEELVGKTVIYLANLKPAKIRGVLSQGMILAAGDEQVLALSALDRPVAPGTKIR
ncbi:MAG TPA: methionine--tRNA ligase [Polyangia bacterium]